MIGLQECGPAPPGVPPSGGRARERTAQALEYCNTNLQRARVNAALSRSSYNDRHNYNKHINHLSPEALYRSNSSLELLDHHNGRPSNTSPTLKREYGSHGSIDVIDRPTPVVGASESFFAMLQEYKPTVLNAISTDQRSPGPSEYLRGKVDAENTNNCLGEDNYGATPQSPKLRAKISKFWGSGNVNGNTLKNQRQAMDDSVFATSSSNSSVIATAELEEIARRRALAHYDCQSLTTNLSYVMRIRRSLLAKRRNTTTGASAASMIGRSSTPDKENADDDPGDGHNNDLVESCPYFRNEIGGEEERIVSLTRLQNGQHRTIKRPLHRPPLAYGVAVLEYPYCETHWTLSTCPYQRLPRPIESVDQGALYYRKYFVGNEHQNWFGVDEQLGPVAISIRREKVQQPENNTHSLVQYQYRLVVRTSELLTLRGSILEDAIPNIKHSNSKTMNIKEVLEYVAPEIQLSCLRLGLQNEQIEDQLLKLDEQGLTNNYKVGIMYCKAEQSTEEEMYNNEEAGPAFEEFLETIGKKVRLQGFTKYKAGLDNKSDSTGLWSVYAQHQDREIMFHVSTMLPFTPNNKQQLLRKRHIGNDIVTIVFQEPGAYPFTPKGIRSQFQHVFIVVRAINPCTENTHYKVAVSRSRDVQVFGPPIKEGAIFPKGKAFAEFLLAKVVNAENAAHRSEKFVSMATRTRQEYLKDLVTNSSSTTTVETGQKFSLFSSTKKKEKIRLRFIPDVCQRGALLWKVLLDDSGQSQHVECFLGISSDTLVLIEELTKQIVFVSPCKSILGWSAQTNSLRIYHHQGECITIHMRDSHLDRDELMEVVERLEAVSQGVLVQELTLRRNIMGQLGFHVQPDGIVTLVESQGQAWQAGLRQNSRLVEICKIAVSTLTHDQMVDLLKTSICVTLTVIPPLPDGSARKGCTLQNCKYNDNNYESDYETAGNEESKHRKAPHGQRAVPGNHRIYDRSFSPPRSCGSSGYETGSSSKSCLFPDTRYNAGNTEGTLTSSSSGNSGDDRWYELIPDANDIPPPLPNKNGGHSIRSSNTYPSNRNSKHQTSQVQVTQSHKDFGLQTPQHTKIQISNSLPLHHSNFSGPLRAVVSNNMEYESNYKLDKNNIIKQQRQEAAEYVHGRNPKVEYQLQLYNDLSRSVNDCHSNDSSVSDRLHALGSEDDLSIGGNISPRSKSMSKHYVSLPNTTSTRNHSPRSINGEAKLRPGVTARSSNRNSANLQSSTFQEDLIRLINPDNFDNGESSLNINNHSAETLTNSLPVHKTQPEVILTMARPATVISNASTTSSPLPSEFNKNSNNDRISPSINSVITTTTSKNKNLNVGPEDLPLPEDIIDWSSLVDTATRALQENDSLQENHLDRNKKHWEDGLIDASITSNVSTSTSVPELQSHVTELETRVSRETRRRLSLEDEVRRLKEENRKLQDQAQAAVQQLRKFTEWFFKNVQRQ